mmetsp:Transcript_166132/g.533238  ORF Transcript_166132/g.533238 Transcript_166132/m.533238 type:complete len:435 (-) Transcript_166132:809-2113(-)
MVFDMHLPCRAAPCHPSSAPSTNSSPCPLLRLLRATILLWLLSCCICFRFCIAPLVVSLHVNCFPQDLMLTIQHLLMGAIYRRERYKAVAKRLGHLRVEDNFRLENQAELAEVLLQVRFCCFFWHTPNEKRQLPLGALVALRRLLPLILVVPLASAIHPCRRLVILCKVFLATFCAFYDFMPNILSSGPTIEPAHNVGAGLPWTRLRAQESFLRFDFVAFDPSLHAIQETEQEVALMSNRVAETQAVKIAKKVPSLVYGWILTFLLAKLFDKPLVLLVPDDLSEDSIRKARQEILQEFRVVVARVSHSSAFNLAIVMPRFEDLRGEFMLALDLIDKPVKLRTSRDRGGDHRSACEKGRQEGGIVLRWVAHTAALGIAEVLPRLFHVLRMGLHLLALRHQVCLRRLRGMHGHTAHDRAATSHLPSRCRKRWGPLM